MEKKTYSFQVTGLYPVNWAFPDRFKTAENQKNNIKNELENFRSSATETVFGMRSIRQSDEYTAVEILNIARNIQNSSRMVQELQLLLRTKRQLTVF